MKTQLILLAAGQSKRFGGIKQLADIHGLPMICHCLSQYRQDKEWLEGITNGYVVLGANAKLIAKVLPDNIDTYLVPSWVNGMGYGLAQAIQEVASDTSHVLIGLADQVALTQKILSQLIDKSKTHPLNIVAAKYAGGLGAPVIFPKKYFLELSQLTGDKGAKVLLQKNIRNVKPVDLPLGIVDIDTTQDLDQYLKSY